MLSYIITFIVGLFVGAFIGTGFMALFYAAGHNSEEEYRRELNAMKVKRNSETDKNEK